MTDKDQQQAAAVENEAAGRGSLSQAELDELIASSDTGARGTVGAVGKFIMLVAVAWSLFQLWIASPLPFMFRFGVLNDTEARSFHLAFALFLAFAAFPAARTKVQLTLGIGVPLLLGALFMLSAKEGSSVWWIPVISLCIVAAVAAGSPKDRIPLWEWALAVVGAGTAIYIYVNYASISNRVGAPIPADFVVAVAGLLLLLEATRRALGPALMIVASVFLVYTILGPWMPGIIAHKGNNLSEIVNHHWITTQGVFGIALGVSTSFVFLFVLFGSLLDKAGAGNYFIQVAFSLMGHMRGGPAKAAVVSSAMTGLISGSSIANVVTTGTFTIPLMKKVGFSSEKAGAVEVASSVNGQIMPPVMGAAAFLMVEYVGIPYFDVVKHAFLPAVISYIALVYIVHLEAMKANMQGLPRAYVPSPLLRVLVGFSGGIVAVGIIYWLIIQGRNLSASLDGLFGSFYLQAALIGLMAIGFAVLGKRRSDATSSEAESFVSEALSRAVWVAYIGFFFVLVSASVFAVREHLPEASSYILFAMLVIGYVALLYVASREEPLHLDDPNAPVTALPLPGPTIRSGLHYILPVVVLVWALMVDRLSPGLSAFWATAFMIFILVTQRPLMAILRGEGAFGVAVREGLNDLVSGLETGARNMIGIGIATATAGIIVGAVSQTGVGSALAEVVEVLSGGNILAILLLTAVLSLILGMGLPTTANYIVVSALLAPVIVTLGQQNGLIVPLIAVHLFVFYFGIMADVTPPVGLASFAAAAVSGGDPIRTGVVAFFYSLRTAALPFLFIFNTELLLIEVGWIQGIFVFCVATVAMLLFAAATQGWFLAKNRFYESAALLLIAFSLFRPGFWMDMVAPPFEEVSPSEIVAAAESTPLGEDLRIRVAGVNDLGDPIEFVAVVELGEGATGEEKLASAGLVAFRQDGERMIIDDVAFDSAAQKAGLDWDQEVLRVLRPVEVPSKYWMFIPALALLALIVILQRGRAERAQPAPA